MNQHDIVNVFRGMGFSVAVTSMVGNGFPDIVLGKNFRCWLVEIKDGMKPSSERKLTENEMTFHDNWRGAIYIVASIAEAIELGTKLNGEK
jgi:Holliday junction resolvase